MRGGREKGTDLRMPHCGSERQSKEGERPLQRKEIKQTHRRKRSYRGPWDGNDLRRDS